MKATHRNADEHNEYIKLIEGNLLKRFNKIQEDEFFAWLSSVIYRKGIEN